MKKHLMVAAGLAVLSTSAFATKARLQALGQDTSGSFFIEDTRNVFLNPAFVNQYNNYVVTEWGTASSVDETEDTPHAEGGFFRKMGSMSYGLYLGNEDGFHNSTKGSANLQTTDNNMELFFAGNMGFDWGARLSYSASDSDTASTEKVENDSMGLGFGISKGHMEAYTNLLLKDESKGSTSNTSDKFEADLGLQIGGSYKMNKVTYFVDYDKSGYETNLSSVKSEVEETDMILGAGYEHEVEKTSKFFYSLSYHKVEEETKSGASTTTVTETALPLTIGFETEATSWLTLRASVKQNIIINDYEKEVTGSAKEERTMANTTKVNAGATLNFGKLMIDGVIGTTNGDRAGDTGTKDGVLATDNLMTRVAVHYWF